MAGPKRMDSDGRRRQLLAAALDLVRREGTEGLTLARVAEAAGVTKPIAYRHFGDRAGLLKALYVDYDERQNAAMREALAVGGDDLAAVARIVAGAYVDCVMQEGPEMGGVAAALSATEDMEAFRDGLREGYLRHFHEAFEAVARPASAAEYLGILGASDALGQAAASGRLARDGAVAALTTLILGTLRPI